MNMNIKQKLTSRKFWVALITILTGILGIVGAEDNVVQIITSALLTLVPTIIYIITEGKIDAASVSTIVTTVGETIGTVIDVTDKSNNEEPEVNDENLTE